MPDSWTLSLRPTSLSGTYIRSSLHVSAVRQPCHIMFHCHISPPVSRFSSSCRCVPSNLDDQVIGSQIYRALTAPHKLQWRRLRATGGLLRRRFRVNPAWKERVHPNPNRASLSSLSHALFTNSRFDARRRNCESRSHAQLVLIRAYATTHHFDSSCVTRAIEPC